MRFENAAKGLKKLIAAEILSLAAYAAAAIAILFALIFRKSYELNSSFGAKASELGAGFFLIVTALLSIVGIIIAVFGYINAIKDDKEFKKALFYVILYIGTYISAFFIPGDSPAYTTVVAVGEVFQLFAMINALLGTKSIAEKLGDQAFVRRNRIMNVFISAFSVIAVIATVLDRIFGEYGLSPTLCDGMQLLSELSLCISGILFMIHLMRAYDLIDENA